MRRERQRELFFSLSVLFLVSLAVPSTGRPRPTKNTPTNGIFDVMLSLLNHREPVRFLLVSLAVLPIASSVVFADEPSVRLPVGSHPPPLDAPHFPDRLHAVVWRNWRLVQPERIAAAVGTDVGRIRSIARSMGLPPAGDDWREMQHRGYITIVRRNWHLLPYDQLLTLLDKSPGDLYSSLKEDDFLFVKLGSLKPDCEPVLYQAPTEAVAIRASGIRKVVERYFESEFKPPPEPRFDFVRELSSHAGPHPVRRQALDGARPGLRFIYSYFGSYGDPLSDSTLDPYPDGLLSRLAAQGVNGVWLHIVLRQLAPGGVDFPEFGEGHAVRLENLRRLVARAQRFGIGVYLYLNEPRAMPASFFESRPDVAGVREGDFVALCTSEARVRRWMASALTHVFHEVPDLAGVFTITASENLTSCASHFRREQCERCGQRTEADIIAEVNTTVAEGVHRSSPGAKVIAWDWGWNRHGEAPDTIAQLPDSVWLMSVSEWSKPIERGGVRSVVGEYSLSAVGPGPRARRHWAHAKERGLRTVAKVQLNTTWELASVPYLPVLDLVAEHCAALAGANIDGAMLSWTVGGYPSPNLQVAARFAELPGARVDEVLNEIAFARYGAGAAPHAREAWRSYSSALREYPLHGSVLYNGPQQKGPANLLYAEPTGFAATMVGIPYDDLDGWRGPYPAEVFAGQFEKIAAGWGQGLVQFDKVVARTSGQQRRTAEEDRRVARAARLHFASVAHQARFILARDRLRAEALSAVEQKKVRAEIRRILEAEIELARKLFTLSWQDSRLGFEASNHYFYVPLDCAEKVINAHFLLEKYGESGRD